MTVKELIKMLQKEDQDSIIMMDRDEEGNGSPMRMWKYSKGFLGSVYRNPKEKNYNTIDPKDIDLTYLEFYHEDEIEEEEKPLMLKAVLFEPA
ncbi:MAG: hypothetical protein WC942_08100 [Clostridia bacterium]|jgi:hypothetical protein